LVAYSLQTQQIEGILVCRYCLLVTYVDARGLSLQLAEGDLTHCVEVMVALDTGRQLRCVLPAVGKQHEFAARPCRHLAH
jgi:hypothetical protein